jgi:hypothetical protein
LPSASAVTEYAPSSFAIAWATASASGASSLATSAAINSVSELESSLIPAAASSLRNSEALTRLPLWPSATVCARPCRISGWAFDHCAEPVVE